MKIRIFIYTLLVVLYSGTVFSKTAPAPIIINPQPSGNFFLFCHSLDANAGQARYYTRASTQEKSRPWYLLPHTVVTFNFPDADLNPRRSDSRKTTLGQGKELQCIANTLREVLAGPCTQRSCVMVGISRGAVAAINYCALTQPTQVQALILESPFDHIDTIVQERAKNSYFKWLPGINFVTTTLFDYLYPAHDRQGPQPIDLISRLPKQMPILIVHAETDTITPLACSKKLVQKLQESGHTNVYFLSLQEGKHALLRKGKSAQLYQEITHAFLAAHNLTHDPALAAAGKSKLSRYHVTTNTQ